jgi:peptidoglycan/xylan/chitin deacetylase (PgdA/CDA1 family)
VNHVYEPDRSLKGKARRRLVRLVHRRPARVSLERPMVSFTFDDALASAAHEGAVLLEQAGARGTYFFAAELVGRVGPMGPFASVADVRELAARGHEIGCHTATHLDCGQADGERALGDVEANTRRLAEWGVPQPTTFAYPYGDVNARTKAALGARFSLLRALHHGVVATGADLNQCPAVGIEGPDGAETAFRWLDAAAKQRAWVIFYTHDVAERPSQWGCASSTLARLIDVAMARGLELVTVAEGARRVTAAAA